MAPPNSPRIIAGTVAAAITLTAGAAIGSDDVPASEEPKLDDVVLIRDVSPPEWSASDIAAATSDSVASPFDSFVSVESVDSVDSADSVDSVDSVESVESVDSVDSADSVDSVDSADSVDSVDSVDSP